MDHRDRILHALNDARASATILVGALDRLNDELHVTEDVPPETEEEAESMVMSMGGPRKFRVENGQPVVVAEPAEVDDELRAVVFSDESAD